MAPRSARMSRLVVALALGLTLSTAPIAATKKKAPAGPPSPPTACADLYAHVNSEWLRAHPQPGSRWDEMIALADGQVRALLRDPTPGAGGSNARLLADLVASGQDNAAIDAAGLRALQPLLAQIAAARKTGDVAAAIAALHANGVPALFGFDIERDAGTGQSHARFRAGGLGLRDPAFYSTSAAAELPAIKGLYRSYLAGLLRSAGYAEADATAQADLALAMEHELAAASTTPSGFQALSVKDAAKAYKALALANFLKAQGLAATQVEFAQPQFFALANQKLAKPNVAQWQAYLRVQLLQAFAPFLGGGVRDAHDRLFNGLLAGAPTPAAEDRAALLVSAEAGELLSAAYAERHPGGANVARAEAIAAAVRTAFDQALSRAAWMSPESREAARKQLAAMRLSIGTAEPASFAGLGFDRGNYAGNVLALRRWRHAQSMARLAKPVWPDPVSQAQPLVGFEPGQNRLIVTAATLQAPVLVGVDAADYGALGALIAQQMAQDLRRLAGNDARAYQDQIQPLVAQYGAFTGVPGGDGNRFLAQSAADVGGVDIAWQALSARGAPATGDAQTFFKAWAGLWARQGGEAFAQAPEALSYPPVAWRANAPAMNHPAFAAAFACRPGQAMVVVGSAQVGPWR